MSEIVIKPLERKAKVTFDEVGELCGEDLLDVVRVGRPELQGNVSHDPLAHGMPSEERVLEKITHILIPQNVPRKQVPILLLDLEQRIA